MRRVRKSYIAIVLVLGVVAIIMIGYGVFVVLGDYVRKPIDNSRYLVVYLRDPDGGIVKLWRAKLSAAYGFFHDYTLVKYISIKIDYAEPSEIYRVKLVTEYYGDYEEPMYIDSYEVSVGSYEVMIDLSQILIRGPGKYIVHITCGEAEVTMEILEEDLPIGARLALVSIK